MLFMGLKRWFFGGALETTPHQWLICTDPPRQKCFLGHPNLRIQCKFQCEDKQSGQISSRRTRRHHLYSRNASQASKLSDQMSKNIKTMEVELLWPLSWLREHYPVNLSSGGSVPWISGRIRKGSSPVCDSEGAGILPHQPSPCRQEWENQAVPTEQLEG